MIDQTFRHEQVVVNGVRLHYASAGDPAGPLVLLLHGFPECWYSWRHQLPALAEAGFYAVAPDMRGYARSEKPPGVASYTVDELAGDVAGLVDALGRGKAAAVVGHDWGGGVAWAFGALYAERTSRLAIVNCPPAGALLQALRRPAQLARSWYIGFFQIPVLPELLLYAGGLRFLDRALAPAQARNPAAVTTEDIAYLRRELARPGALTAAINYYRALPRMSRQVRRRCLAPVSPPTLVIWGERDPYLGIELVEGLPRWAKDARLVRWPDAGHFAHQEQPQRTGRLLLRWLHDETVEGG